MPRNILIGRSDWVRYPGVVFSPLGAAWPIPLSNMAESNPQLVAEAPSRAQADTGFTVDLLYPRRIGAFHFANLRASASGIMQITATGVDGDGNPATVYDSGTVSIWPKDADAGENNPWGEFTLSGVYNSALYGALGMPRVFVPPAPIIAQTITVEFSDPTSVPYLRIGRFGAHETWEPPINFSYDWSLSFVDDSTIQRPSAGGIYISQAGSRRRMNFGFAATDETEINAHQLDLMLVKGQSDPLLVVPFPEDTANLEKNAIYGLVSSEGQLSNPFFGVYSSTFQIDQIN